MSVRLIPLVPLHRGRLRIHLYTYYLQSGRLEIFSLVRSVYWITSLLSVAYQPSSFDNPIFPELGIYYIKYPKIILYFNYDRITVRMSLVLRNKKHLKYKL